MFLWISLFGFLIKLVTWWCHWKLLTKPWQVSKHWLLTLNTLRLRQNGCQFKANIFKCMFLNQNAWISIVKSMKFVPKGPNNNISALVQIMAWHRPGAKPLSEPMMVSLPMHICITQPQWVNMPSNHMISYQAVWEIHLILCYKSQKKIQLTFRKSTVASADDLWPLLLTWFNFNPTMDK